jgi:RNA polymerase sigma-70 factor (ECF subfamily)
MSSISDDLRPLDEQAFGARVEPHRRELHVHCYRLLGSFEEAEDLVQEAFLRAWRRRETYEGRASVRAWLYRIATNACLDALDKRPRRPSASGEVAWLQPYPDELLEQLPDRREGPEDVALAKGPSSWRSSSRSSTSRRCRGPCSCCATSSAARRTRPRGCSRRQRRR